MVTPDDEDRVFVSRWNALISALIIEPSIKLVAYQAAQYGIADGTDVYPGNARLSRQTGLSEKTVRDAWHFMRATGMAERDSRSTWTGDRRTADLYQLVIPPGWRSMPVLGPHAGKFTCQYCGRQFTPLPCNVFLMKNGRPVVDRDGDREVRWKLPRAVFCAPPRGRKGDKRQGPGCFADWQRSGGKWGDDAWEMLRKARHDDW